MEYYVVSSVNGSNATNDVDANVTAGGDRAGAGEGSEAGDGWIWDDATWILCASFIIFTMQTGELNLDYCVPLRFEFRAFDFDLVICCQPQPVLPLAVLPTEPAKFGAEAGTEKKIAH